MAAITTLDSQRRSIDVYLLAAPEDQSVCEEIAKHLGPIIRSAPIPIKVDSDFNAPPGTDKEQHKERLWEAEIVLALISVDFINNDEIHARNQKVIERYNRGETVMIPILVRNCLWTATPFSSLPIVPKNLQPLNNKQFWNSPDDAVMAVVSDIYNSINELARVQREAAEKVPAPQAPAEAPKLQTEAPDLGKEIASRAVAEAEPEADLAAPVEISTPQTDAESPVKELYSVPSEAMQFAPAVQAEPAPALEVIPEVSIPQPEPSDLMPALAEIPEEALPPAPAAPVESTPAAVPGKRIREITSAAVVPIDLDWRKKYYRTLLLKRAGAILLDHLVLYIAIFIALIPVVFITDNESFLMSATNWIFVILYFGVMPWMESSKWQGTIGKRILKLQITDREGDRITFVRAVWRNIMRSVVLYTYFLSAGILLVVQYLRFNKSRKLFHDELSGTVIGERLTSSQPASDIASVAGHAA